ncbi:MAG: tRNA (adenosine(37)-N6)-threonylcarbamoyltransferase complex ATPase subunit type 1 TsaE [Candidatus Acidiferrum sp.]
MVYKFEGKSRVVHVALCRVRDFHDLETLGLEDIFSESAIVIVEWPDRLKLRTHWPGGAD